MGDEFLARVRKTIAHRAGHRCANPNCRRLTSKPDPEDLGRYIDLGTAAHITAASPGGPRYDGALTAEQRSAPDNGLWLCRNCGKEIDSAPDTFPVMLLREWK